MLSSLWRSPALGMVFMWVLGQEPRQAFVSWLCQDHRLLARTGVLLLLLRNEGSVNEQQASEEVQEGCARASVQFWANWVTSKPGGISGYYYFFAPCHDKAMAALPSTCCNLSGRSGQEAATKCPGNKHLS